MRNVSLKYLLFFLLTAFVLVGCGIFESEPTKEEPEEEIERTYTKTIERSYSNEFERALIDSAEAVYPLRDSVVVVLDLIYPWRDNESLIQETEYWHMASLDGVLQPYMITNDAVSYYTNLIDSLNAGLMQYIKEAKLSYGAEIYFYEEFVFEWPEYLLETIKEITNQELEPSEHFTEVYVVEMSLGWSHHCIEHCYAGFSIKRVVILDKFGNVIRIFMDGPWWPAMVT